MNNQPNQPNGPNLNPTNPGAPGGINQPEIPQTPQTDRPGPDEITPPGTPGPGETPDPRQTGDYHPRQDVPEELPPVPGTPKHTDVPEAGDPATTPNPQTPIGDVEPS